MYGTCPALTYTATEFCSYKPEMIPEHPEQWSIFCYIHFLNFPVDVEIENSHYFFSLKLLNISPFRKSQKPDHE
jgi:hypothetical protein